MARAGGTATMREPQIVQRLPDSRAHREGKTGHAIQGIMGRDRDGIRRNSPGNPSRKWPTTLGGGALHQLSSKVVMPGGVACIHLQDVRATDGFA